MANSMIFITTSPSVPSRSSIVCVRLEETCVRAAPNMSEKTITASMSPDAAA